MVRRLFVVIAALVAINAHSETCDGALIPQQEYVLDRQQTLLAWLSIVDEQTYDVAKQKAAGQAYSNMFSGDYKSFGEKRRKLFSEQNFNLDINNARESYKSYLTEKQLIEWRKCKAGYTEIIVSYEDVDETGLTLKVEWHSPKAVGSLRDIKFDVEGGTVNRGWSFGPPRLSGTEAYTVTRKANEPFRGVVRGRAGVGQGQSYAAAIYVPKYVKDSVVARPIDIQPDKSIVSVNGKIYQSSAFWDKKRRLVGTLTCLPPQPGMDLVIVATQTLYLGQRRGACMNINRTCDSQGEECRDELVKSGCYINKQWHEWYKRTMNSVGAPYSREAVCQENS